MNQTGVRKSQQWQKFSSNLKNIVPLTDQNQLEKLPSNRPVSYSPEFHKRERENLRHEETRNEKVSSEFKLNYLGFDGSFVTKIDGPGFEKNKNQNSQQHNKPQSTFKEQNGRHFIVSNRDLQIGAQGYSSCSDNQSVEDQSRSAMGVDTYQRSHLPSSQYEQEVYGAGLNYPEVRSSKKSQISKAYGMEHGNWLCMDASIQHSIMHDTSVMQPQNNKLTQDEHYSVNFPQNIKSNTLIKNQDISNEQVFRNKTQSPTHFHSIKNKEQKIIPFATKDQRNNQEMKINENIYDVKKPQQTSFPYKSQTKYQEPILPLNISLDDTMLLLNEKQNTTIYQITKTVNKQDSKTYFKQVPSPRRTDFQKASSYQVTFKIAYNTEFGENISVVGNIPELGEWKSYKISLKWTEGHVWVSEPINITSNYFFTYKYVIMSQKKDPQWESGPSRIADLEILHDLNKKNSRIAGDLSVDRNSFSQDGDSFTSGIQSRFSNRQSQHTSGILTYDIQSIGSASKRIENFHQNQKKVELKDDWEQFTIRFTLFAPENYDNKDSEFLRIIGSIPELTKAGTVESGPKKMKRSRRQFRWLYDKYGLELRPWECQIKVRVDRLFEITELIYGYSKKDSNRADFIYEREPSRRLIIQPPETYRGELGVQRSSQWREQDKVWIVNGHIEKADGNFLGELFFTKIGDQNLSIGTYIFDQHEVQRLKQAGITAVLNLMSSNNLTQRGIEIQQLQTAYKTRGMKHLKYSINDSREQDLISNLFIAAQHLNNILNALNSKVYVHCCSGISRAPSVVLTYLCIFKKVKSWRSVDDTMKFLKMFNQKLQPNVRAVKKCIELNESFQKEQQENFYGALGLQRNSKIQNEGIEDSFYFPNMVIEESNHNPLKNQKNDLTQKMFTKQYTQLSPISEDGQPTLNFKDDLRKNLFTENQDKKKEFEKNEVFLPPDIEFEKILADEHVEELLKESDRKSIEKPRKYTPEKIDFKPQIDEEEIRQKLKEEFEQKFEEQLNSQKIKLENEANQRLQAQKKETEKQLQQQELITKLAETKKIEEQKRCEKLQKELELKDLKEQQAIEQHQKIIKVSQELLEQELLQKDKQIQDLKEQFEVQLGQKDLLILELKSSLNQLLDNHKNEIQIMHSKQVNENHEVISKSKEQEKRLLKEIQDLNEKTRQEVKTIQEQNQIERQALIDKFIQLEQERSQLAENKVKQMQQQHKLEKDELIKQMDQQQKAQKSQSSQMLISLQNELKKQQTTNWQKEQTTEMEYKTEIQKLELTIESQQNALQNQANKIDQIKSDKLIFEMETKNHFQNQNNQLQQLLMTKEDQNLQMVREIALLQEKVDYLQGQVCLLEQNPDKEEFEQYLLKDQEREIEEDFEKSPVPSVFNQEKMCYGLRDDYLKQSYYSSGINSDEVDGRKSDLIQGQVCYQLACEQLNEELLVKFIEGQTKEIAENEINIAKQEQYEKEEKQKNQKEYEVALSIYFGQFIESQVCTQVQDIAEKEISQAKEKQLYDQALNSFVTQFIEQELRSQTKLTISQELQDLKKQKELETLLEMKQKELLKAKNIQSTAQVLDSFVTQFIQEEIEIELNDIVYDELENFKNQFIKEQAIASINNYFIEDFTHKFLKNIISDEIDEQKQLAIAQKRERKGRNTRKQQANQQIEKSSKQISSHPSSKDISPADLQVPQQEITIKQPVITDFFRQQILQTEAEIEAIRKMQQLEAEKLKLISLKNQVARNEELKQTKDEQISNYNESMPQMDDNTSQKSIKTCQNFKTIAFDDNYQRLKLTAQHSAEDFLQTSIPSQNQNFLEQIEPMPSIFDVQSQQLDESNNQYKGDYTEEQYHLMAQQFFQIPPIKFRARRGVILEEIIASTVQTIKSSLPIIYIRGTLYLVGTQKCICEVKNKTVLLRVQGNSQAGPEELSTKQSSNFSKRESGQLQNQRGLHQRLDNYLQENEQKMRIEFCKMMITHHMNLETVCEQLISDKMFKQKFQSFGTSYTEFQGINLYNQFKKDQNPAKGQFHQKRMTLPEAKKQNLTMNPNPKVSSIDLVSALKQKQTGPIKVSQINLDRSQDDQPINSFRDSSPCINQTNNQMSRSQGREFSQNQLKIVNEQLDFRQINRGNRRDVSKSDGIDSNIVQMGYLDALNKNINKGSRQGMTRYAQEESEY